MPFTVTSKEEAGRNPRSSFVGSLAHAAHTLPRGSCLRGALQGHGAVTRGIRDVFERTSAFWFSRGERLELTSQAPVRGRSARPSARTDCLARIAPTAAP
jgi:hypothetical protein